MRTRLLRPGSAPWLRSFASALSHDVPVGFREVIFNNGQLQERQRRVTEADPQFSKFYQMLYKSTSWRDLERYLQEAPTDARYTELTWNTLKMMPDSYGASRGFLQVLAERTMAVSDELQERGFASVFHAMGKMNLLHPELLQKLTEKAMFGGLDGAFLIRFSPRHMLNVLHGVARIHRVARARNQLLPTGEAFSHEKGMVGVLLRESFKRLNEFNEQDLSSLAISMASLKVPVEERMYRQLAEEVEKGIHLERFSNYSLAQVAFGLTNGGGVDLWKTAPRLVREILKHDRIADTDPRLLALFVRCLCETEHKPEDLTPLLPLFKKLVRRESMELLQGVGFRSVVAGLGFFRIKTPELWDSVIGFLMEFGFTGLLSPFDLSSVLYSMALVRFHRLEILEKIAEHLMQDPATLENLSCWAISNCLFAVGSLRYRNNKFILALCSVVMEGGKPKPFSLHQMTNIVFSLAQVHFREDAVIRGFLNQAIGRLPEFANRSLVHFVFGLSLDMYFGEISELTVLFEEVFSNRRLESYSNDSLGMAMCALGKMKPILGHRLPAIREEIQSERRLGSYALQDVVRIVKALVEMRHPIPVALKERLLRDMSKMSELPNRLFLDFLHCLESIEEKTQMTQLQTMLELALSNDRLERLADEELRECITAVGSLSSQLSSPLDALMEEILEKVIVQGTLKCLSGAALYSALSTLGYTKRNQNRPVLYSLTVECTKPPRLKNYSEQQITGIFYNLSLLHALHRIAFDAFVDEMLIPGRLAKYQENHVVKIVKGLSLGKHKNGLIVNAVLNAFLLPDRQLEPATVATLLFNLVLLNCWKRPYVDLLLDQISKRENLDDYSLWAVGVVTYVLGRNKYKNAAILVLLCQQLTKDRLQDATELDLCNLLFGLAYLHHDEPSSTIPLLSELLKSSRCSCYNNNQLVRIFQSFAEWQMVDPSQLAGLTEQLQHPQRCTSMRSLQLLMILKSLSKLHLFQSDIVGYLLSEITSSAERMEELTHYELQELSFLAGMARADAALEKIQGAASAKALLHGTA